MKTEDEIRVKFDYYKDKLHFLDEKLYLKQEYGSVTYEENIEYENTKKTLDILKWVIS